MQVETPQHSRGGFELTGWLVFKLSDISGKFDIASWMADMYDRYNRFTIQN